MTTDQSTTNTQPPRDDLPRRLGLLILAYAAVFGCLCLAVRAVPPEGWAWLLS